MACLPTRALADCATQLGSTVGIPERTPRYRQLRSDDGGRLWVETYSLDDHAPGRWVVYARVGARVGSLTLPPGSRLLDASERELPLARRGRAGGERLQVVRYRLR